MKENCKRIMAMLMVLALILQYSAGIDSLAVYATDSSTVAEQEQNSSDESAEAQSNDTEGKSDAASKEKTKDEAPEGSQPADENADADQEKPDPANQGNEPAAPAEVQEEAGSEESPEEQASTEEDAKDETETVTQTVREGEAEITAEYSSDIFKEDVKLKAREIAADSKEFGKAEKTAVKALNESKAEALFAYDITFVSADGTELEPTDAVKISIKLNKAPADRTLSKLDLVHIKDDGKAEVLDDAKINKDATKVEFENDQFSPYVVVEYYDYSQSGSYTIQGDEDTYDTLNEAIDNVMSSGEIIVVSADTTEEGGQTLGGFECRIVPGDKDVTITFNGNLTIDDDFSIGGVNSTHNITVVVTGDFTLEDGASLYIGKGGTLKLNPEANNSLSKTDVTLEDGGKIEGYTFPDPVKAFVPTAKSDNGEYDIEGLTAYETLQEAVAAARSGDVILVTADTSDASNVVITKDITLRAYNENVTLKAANGYKQLHVGNGGKLHLGDGTPSPTLTIRKSRSDITVGSGGTIEFNDGAVLTLSEYGVALTIWTGGTVNIKGGIVEHQNNWDGGAVNATGTLNVSGGSVRSLEGDAIQIDGNGHLTVSGGTIQAEPEYAAINLTSYNSYLDYVTDGVIIGGTAIERNYNTVNNKPSLSGGEIKALDSDGYAFSPKVMANLSGSVKWLGKYDEDTYTVTEGYMVAPDTTTASLPGDFHYLNKQVRITYDGNGGKTSSNATTISKGVSTTFNTIENEFLLDGKAFKEWNTGADGNGTSYAEGAEMTIDADTTLYAIWETPDGPVSIQETGEVYNSIREAMAAAQDGQTIVVSKNVADTSDPIEVDKNVTIVGGDDKATSTNANLRVNAGKSLTLGDGSASNDQLTFKGSVNVTDGKVVLQDGITLRKTLKLSGNSSTGTITGGAVRVSSGNALTVNTGATIDSITGGTFISTDDSAVLVFSNAEITRIEGGTFKSSSSHGMDLYGTVRTISGANTEIQGKACGILVRQQGVLETINNGQFSSTTTDNNHISAGLFVQGKCGTINGGSFTGAQGAQFGNTTGFAAPNIPANMGVQINGGIFRGVGSFGIDFVANDGSTILESYIKNATIISEEYYALNINGGHHITEISGVTGTGPFDGISVKRIDASTSKTTIDKIIESKFSSMTIDCFTTIGTIDGVEVTGSTRFGGYEDVPATIGMVSNSSFADVLVENAIIDKMDSITVSDGLSNCEEGEIKLITGDTEVTGESYAIDNDGNIGTITSGDFTGGYAAINNAASIDAITGGNYIGNTWFGIWNNGGTIGRIAIPEGTTSVFKGPWAGVGMYDGVKSVSGHGVFIATDEENGIGTLYGNTKLETAGGTDLNLEQTDDVIGYGRYYNANENTAESILNGSIDLPDGYHMSKVTTKVSGQTGDFHFLVKDNTIIYKGNGHKLLSGKGLESGLDDESFCKVSEKIEDNSYSGKDDFQFDDNYLELISWNTKADGSGTEYKPGDAVPEIPEGEELVLYAQWNYFYEVTVDGQKTEGDGQKFGRLQDAINATTADKPLVLTLVEHEETGTFEVPADKDVILDVATGATLTAKSSYEFDVFGGLEVRDGITIDGAGSVTVHENGKFIGRGGKVISSGSYALYFLSNTDPDSEISGGEYTAADSAIYSYGNIKEISGGKFSGGGDSGAGAKLLSGCTIKKISGGTFEAPGTQGSGIMMLTATIDEISGGEFYGGTDATFNQPNPNGYGILIGTNASVGLISGGKFTAAWAVLHGNADASKPLTITGGEFKSINPDRGAAFQINGNSKHNTAAVKGGTFKGTIGIINFVNLTVLENANIETKYYSLLNRGNCGDISNCTMSSECSDAIVNYAKTSTINSIKSGTYASKEQTGIYNNGTIEDIVAAEGSRLTVKGKTYAIYNDADATISNVSGHFIFKSEGDTAVYNGEGAQINLESTGEYNLETDKPGKGYGSYLSKDAKKIIDPANGFKLPEGYAMSREALDDGYYHLIRQLNVTFDPDGGSPDPDDQSVYYGETAQKPGDPAKTGYTIMGWFKKVGATIAETTFDFATAIKENTDLKAKWDANKYIVKFDANTGTGTMANQEFAYDVEQPLTANAFTKTGYTFKGWNTKADGTGEAYKDKQSVNNLTAENGATVTLYAQWTANKDTKYTVQFFYQKEGKYPEKADDADERTGTTDTTAEVTADDKKPSKDGYVFDEDAENILSGTIESDGSLELKVYFKQQFTVEYKPGDHGTFEPVKTDKLDYNADTPAAPEVAGEEGYTFTGWSPEVADKVTEDVTYVAQWKANQYTITFDSNGGSPVDPITQAYGTDVTAPKDPVRKGYTFDGWDKDIPATMPAENMTITAKWKVNQYKVTYKYLGKAPEGASELPADALYDFGSKVKVADPAAAPGYTFSGWSKKDFTMPAENVEITGTFTAKGDTPYKVEHYKEMTEDGKYQLAETEDFTGKTGATVTANPKTYEGFSLNSKAGGAVESGTIAADGSLVLKLFYDRNEYTITFDSNGGSPVDPITQDYGTDVTAPKDPTREGYTFDGWEPAVPKTMPAENMTIAAKWKINQYEITYDLNGGEYDGNTDNIVETYDYNTVINIHEAPTREGYEFLYWKGSEYQPGDSYTVTEDHLFTAQWEEVAEEPEEEEEEPAEPEDTEKPDKAKDKGVKTGDETDLMAIGGIFGASLLGLLAMIRRRKRGQQ